MNLPLEQYTEEVAQAIHQAASDAASQRKRFKKGFSFSDLPVADQLPIWDHIWKNGNSFWIKIQAFFFCEKHLKKEEALLSIWPTIVNWQDHVDSWSLSDCLSKIYSRVLELDPEMVYPVLERWNASDNPWKRRQSIVSLIYYASVRKSVLPFEKLKPLVRNLISDEDYYVQKGMGWTLRELTVCYPEESLEFLMENVKDISPTAFSTATSKLDPIEKQKLKIERKKR